MYDYLIIGAGSAGAHTAYYLASAGAKVLVVDRAGVAAGASGAAGAFISPRLGRGGPLQKITNQAFRHTIELYTKKFSHLFCQSGILRLPKDAADAKKFESYEPFIDVTYHKWDPDCIEFLKPYAKEFGGYFFPDGGVADAHGICRALLADVEVVTGEGIERLEPSDGSYRCGRWRAKEVIVATGAWDELVAPYIRLGKLAGYRLDVVSSLRLPVSVHKRISISVSIGGRIAIGATHTRVDDPSSMPPPSSYLIDEAKKMADLNKVELAGIYCGVRPSVNDHFPYAGECVNVEAALKRYPKLEKGAKIPANDLPRHEGLYMIGGFGGRGFVFGSFLAKKLVDHILERKPLPNDIDADRLFYRWVKKSKIS